MAISNKYDFMMIFDVENGNPNGDPDSGNSPRIDPETNIGIVTDVCLKRKIRNAVRLMKEGEEGYDILIKPDKALNEKYKDAYTACKLPVDKKDNNKESANAITAQKYLCKTYFDVRTFGAVMSTGDNQCGIVKGPVQIGFGKSVAPIDVIDLSITRQAATTTKDFKEKGGHTMGDKMITPYALYTAKGHISAAQANHVTDMSEEDVELLWKAIVNMFEEDHSSSRGEMSLRKLIVFKHDSVLGECPAWLLFDKIRITQCEPENIANKYADYTITINKDMPKGVELIEKI
ncbi:type I-C CRISPR-associated protein Cas7/Csd2 [Aminicella lysinilytica]|uniref:type I-C CRISPR-associated protein Cas7/Csd2 n=1 Tax=Aminicella lysinilytica TaxID=433323 RepID=UPI0026EB2DC5|nr:type I-C CRISPR-associated protein Cas7/Csd2 [Aminicella lysinilytica]